MDGIDVVKNGMKLRYVEVLSNSKVDEDLFVLMKCFQAVFKHVERGAGVGFIL